MQLTQIAILLSLALAPSLSQKLAPNALTSLLQSILSPKNTEKEMQVLTTVANKKRAVIDIPGNKKYIIVDNVPRTLKTTAPKKIALIQNPKNVIVKNPNNVIVRGGKQLVLPKNVVVQRKADMILPKKVVVQSQAEMVLPKNVIVQRKPEMVLPKNVIIKNGEGRNVIVRNEMPKMIVQNKDFVSRRPEVQQKVLVTQPKVEYVVSKQEVCSQNPFLPAASPISALTAASSSLPAAMPKSNGQFLRKFPIPPPTT